MKKVRFSLCMLLHALICICQTSLAGPPPIQLASLYKTQASISDFWVSEKLDGIRGYWDGKRLYTRSDRHIKAPHWFTQNWPSDPLDGELWSKRDDFSFIMSCIQTQKHQGDCWHSVTFMVFDLPAHNGTFTQRITQLNRLTVKPNNPHLRMISQFKVQDETALLNLLDDIVAAKGEGLMLHHENAYYQTGRTSQLLKLKKHQDDEATVLKHFLGKGKYHNKLGAMLVENTSGKVFKIGSGFSDKEREDPPKVGSIITYRFTGKTQNDIPRFARFMRIRYNEAPSKN